MNYEWNYLSPFVYNTTILSRILMNFRCIYVKVP